MRLWLPGPRMHPVRVRLAAAIFLFLIARAAPAAVPDEEAIRAIDRCVAVLEVDVDLGFERINARCPELVRRMQRSDWAAWLPAGWDDPYNDVSARSLAQLEMLVFRELDLERGPRRPDVAALRPIVADVALRNQKGGGAWARFEAWLKRLLKTPASHAQDSSLERITRGVSVPQAILEIVTYGTLAIIVALAVFILINEWRVAGIHRRGRTSRDAPLDGLDKPAGSFSWQDVERAAPLERARVLLEALAARLTAARRLPASAALTVRELARAARLQDAADRARLLDVAVAAEQLRFSTEALPAANLAAVLERGRELLERLTAAAPAERAHGDPA